MELTLEEAARTRAVLGQAPLAEVVRLMTDIFFGRTVSAADPVARAAAEEAVRALGWLVAEGRAMTPLGQMAADSCREYLLWRERAMRLPFERGQPPLTTDHFAGRSVLEIGCGMGVNLMSLSGVAGRLLGVDPVPAYRQFGDIFRALDDLPEVEILTGSGEAIPVADSAFDVLICVTAHQYMDLRRALDEMARVLRPGGELIVIGGTLDAYLRNGLEPVRAGQSGALRRYAVTIVNTLGYMVAGRRPIPARGPGSTARPIYPTAPHMARLISRAGFRVRPHLSLPPETCFLADRLG